LYIQADRARIQADRARRESVAARDFLKDMVTSVQPAKPEPGSSRKPAPEITVREMLMDAKDRVHQYCADQPELEAEIRGALADAFVAVADYPEAEAQARRVVALQTERLGPENPATLLAQLRLGRILVSRGGPYDEAVKLARTSYTGLRRILGVEHADTLRSGAHAVAVLSACGAFEEAETLACELLPLVEHQEALAPDVPTTQKLVGTHISLLLLLAKASEDRGQFQESEGRAREALAQCLRFYDAHHSLTLGIKNRIAGSLLYQYRCAEAEELLQDVVNQYRQEYGAEHPVTLGQTCNMMYAVVHRDPQRAEEELRQIVAQLDDTHSPASYARQALAHILNLEWKYEEAEFFARQALEGYHAANPSADADMPGGGRETMAVAAGRDDLVVALLGRGRVAEAEQIASDLVKWAERRFPTGQYWGFLQFRSHWGQCLRDLGRYEEAEQQLKLAYDRAMTTVGPHHPYTQEVIANLVRLYELWDKPDQAAEWRTKVLATQPSSETRP
jgi:tetratricopeptide (TPR) repeat protein